MTKKKFEIRKQDILPGFEEGRFEPRRIFDRMEFQGSFEDGMRRDNRVSIKVSGKDLSALKKAALEQEIPLQTLLAQIIHHYASNDLAGDDLKEKGQDSLFVEDLVDGDGETPFLGRPPLDS